MQRTKVYKYLTIFFLILTVALTFTNVTFHRFCSPCVTSGYFPNFYFLALANNFLHLFMSVDCAVIEIGPCTNHKIIPIETIFLSLIFGLFWYRSFHGKAIKLKKLAIGVILIGLSVLALGALGISLSYKKVPSQSSNTTIKGHRDIEIGEIYEFTGRATGFDDACVVDGECILYVDNIPVVTNPGDVVSPEGLGVVDVGENEIRGKTVQVRAIKTEKGYSLVGDNSLYIKLADLENISE